MSSYPETLLERLKRIEKNLPCVIYEYESDHTGIGRFLYFSPQIVELTELTVDDALADVRVMLNLIHPEDFAKFVHLNEQAAKSLSVLQAVFRIVTPSGLTKWLRLTSQPQERDANGLSLWNGMILDISAEKASEDALRASHRRFDHMVSALPHGIYEYALHPDGRSEYLYLSTQAEKIYELTLADLRANMDLFWSMVHPDDVDALKKEDMSANKRGDLFVFEFRIIPRSGVTKWLRLSSRPDPHSPYDVAVWRGIIADISEEKNLEKRDLEQKKEIIAANERLISFDEIVLLNKSLEKALEEKKSLLKTMALFAKASTLGNLIASITHEITQPLGAIQLNADNLVRQLNSNKNIEAIEAPRDLLDRILKDNERASDVIARLRKLFTRSSENIEQFDLSEVIKEVCLAFKTGFFQEKVQVDLLGLDRELIIEGDPRQVEMVFVVCINNALDAMRNKNGQKILVIETKRFPTEIRIEISDNGPGIAPQILEKDFEVFHTTKESGMGVGLWLSRSVMENHNGFLTAKNKKEGGAEIRLTFLLSSVLQ